MLISTVLYVAIGLVLTGLVPYTELNVADPLSVALERAGTGLEWLDDAVNIAAVVGLASTVLVTFYGQTRILMRMSCRRDAADAPSTGSTRASRRPPSPPSCAGSRAPPSPGCCRSTCWASSSRSAR